MIYYRLANRTGYQGDQANAVLTAVGYNFRLILALLRLLLRLILAIIVENLPRQ